MIVNWVITLYNPVMLISQNCETAAYMPDTITVAGVSNAYDRQAFAKTTIHVPGATFTVQVSNKVTPDESLDASDWVTLPDSYIIAEGLAYVDMPVTWVRVIGDDLTPGTSIYLLSNQYHF